MITNSTASKSSFLSPSESARLETLETRRLLNGVGLDDSFGDAGSRVLGLEGDQYVYAVKVLTDGSSILVGRVDNGGEGDALLIKLLADGSLDESFGANGVVVQDMGTTADSAGAIEIQDDGKIVIGGQVDGATYDFMVARFNADGSLDESFGGGGFVRVDFSGGFDIGVDMKLTSAGIVIAGNTLIDGKSVPAVATLSDTGDLVSQFVLNGLSADALSVNSLAVKPDGTLLLGATATHQLSDETDFAVVSVKVDGSSPTLTLIDIAPNDVLMKLAVDRDGSCYVVGSANGDFAIAKLAPDGTINASFGIDGKATVDFAGENDQANAIVILPNSDILVAGYATIDGQSDFAMARLTASGVIGSEFGDNGLMTIDFGNTDEAAMAIGMDGARIIVAGRTYALDNDVAAMALTVEESTPQEILNVSIVGSSNLVRGQEGAFVATSDQDGLTYSWDFGDGNVGEGAEVKHVYTEVGVYVVTVTATDESGNSGSATFEVTVDALAIQTDVNGKTNLVAGGTNGNDIMIFRYDQCRKTRGLYAWINGEKSGPFKITGHIIAYGLDGNDILAVKPPMPIAVEFYGGAGSDLLKGSCKADTLVGGDGLDLVISGKSKKDFIETEKIKKNSIFKGWKKLGWC